MFRSSFRGASKFKEFLYSNKNDATVALREQYLNPFGLKVVLIDPDNHDFRDAKGKKS